MSFLNKLGEKASEVYSTTAEKTNKLTREMKLKSLINDYKGKIVKIYQDIGEKVYITHKEGTLKETEKEYSEQLYQIDVYQKEIEKAQNEIRTLKDMKLCEKCSKEISAIAKFCPFCGEEQSSIIPVVQPQKTNEILDQMEEPDIIVEEIGKNQEE